MTDISNLQLYLDFETVLVSLFDDYYAVGQRAKIQFANVNYKAD